MTKTWKEITTSLNEAKFKLPRDQKEVKRDTTKVSGKTVDVTYAEDKRGKIHVYICLLYTSPSPRDVEESRMPSSA